MRFLWKRRMLGTIVTGAGFLTTAWYCRNVGLGLGNPAFVSGYILLALVVALAALAVRKRLTMIPLGSMALWLQVHVYAGVLSLAIFGLHVGWQRPRGVFETMLFCGFVAVAGSGVVGLWLSRRTPPRLTKLRDEILFERIPRLRQELAEEAHFSVVELLQRSPRAAIASVYVDRLVPFFVGHVSLRHHLWRTSRVRNRMQNELRELERYCSADELRVQRRLAVLVDKRDDLDFHAVHQSRLKCWLFVHTGLTLGLIVMVTGHVVLVHTFRGS